MKNANKLVVFVILFFFIPIVYFLYLHSIIGTAVLHQFTEHTYFVSDNWWVHILALVLLMGTGIGLSFAFRKRQLPDKFIDRALMVFTVVYFVLFSAYIWKVRWYPQADQVEVYDAAMQMIRGDYQSWAFDGYLTEWPNQTGLVLFLSLFGLLFGDNAYLWIQQCNVICYVVAAVFLYKTVLHLFQNKLAGVCSYVLFLLFLPFACYTTFVYGTIPGFAASMASLYYLLRYLKEHRIKFSVLSGALIGFAYLCKNNYLVTFAAFLCILAADMIAEKKWKKQLAGMGILVGSLLLALLLSHVCIKAVTGKEVSKGVPVMNFIAMGLQEGPRAPGWYNSYNILSFREAGRDSQLATENAIPIVKQRIVGFMRDPVYLVEFFSKKTASQWNNPTFQGPWIQQSMYSQMEEVPEGVDDAVLDVIMDGGKGYTALTEIFNVFQSLVLSGCILYFFFCERFDHKTLSLGVIVIGGFLFHLLWEAKCQYTVSYFVLLIPYAVLGMISFGKWLLSGQYKLSVRKTVAVMVSLVLLLTVLTLNHPMLQKSFRYYTEDAEYEEYLDGR